MLEKNPAARLSWRQRIAGVLRDGGRSARARSASGACPALDESAAGRRLPSARANVKNAGTALSRWLEESAKVEAYISAANTRLCEQMAGIQVSIILAQDNLSDDDELARQALKRKTDCAENYHRAVCQFNKLADAALCLTALTPQLVRIIELQTPRNVASIMDMAAAPVPPGSPPERTWITQQLTRIRRQLTQLGTRPEPIPAYQLSACVASVNAVVKLLTQHIDDVGRELHQLATVIDELDRFIVAS